MNLVNHFLTTSAVEACFASSAVGCAAHRRGGSIMSVPQHRGAQKIGWFPAEDD